MLLIKRTKTIIIIWLLIIFFTILSPVNIFAGSPPIKIFVSILPQKYFVEQIGKDMVQVDVLVKPGKNPTTYAPLPDQIKKLTVSDIYFKIGIPFENSILHKIESMNKTKIIDTNQNVVLRDMTNHNHFDNSEHAHDNMTGKDPHTWMNPLIVKTQADTIFKTLLRMDSKTDPESNFDKREELKKNYLEFVYNLGRLNEQLHTILKELKGKKIFVFHPFLGYFSDAYGLQQVAIETMGKAPKGKELSRIIKLAKKEKIKTIFVQPQFDQNAANKIATVINGRIISIDPLAYDYFTNMKYIAQTIAQELKTD